MFHQKDRCESCHSFSNTFIVIHLAKRVADEPIAVGSQKRCRIINSAQFGIKQRQRKTGGNGNAKYCIQQMAQKAVFVRQLRQQVANDSPA